MSEYTDKQIERDIQDANLTAPRVTPDKLDAIIADVWYGIIPATTTTICALKLENGFVVVGTSACISPENFDSELGQKIARQKARDQLWQLEGYRKRAELHRAQIISNPRQAYDDWIDNGAGCVYAGDIDVRDGFIAGYEARDFEIHSLPSSS
jgi:hypothetical protein